MRSRRSLGSHSLSELWYPQIQSDRYNTNSHVDMLSSEHIEVSHIYHNMVDGHRLPSLPYIIQAHSAPLYTAAVQEPLAV